MNWMKFSLVACIALEVLRVINFVRSDKSKIQVIAKRVKEGSDAASQVMVELLNSKNKQLAEKDQQIEKEKEEKMILLAEKDKQMAEKDKQMAEKDKQMAEKDKQMAEKDKQIEKEKEEKAEMNKQLNNALLLMQVFGKNAEKEMKGV